MDRKQVYQEIEQMFGTVPEWFKGIPDEAIGEMWELMKKVELSDDSAIPPKYKELIGVAVASALRCRYCSHYHTENARLHGATEGEIKEAIIFSALVSLFSTYLNGSQYDFEHFREETDKMTRHVREKVPAGTR